MGGMIVENQFCTEAWNENYRIYKAIDMEYHKLAIYFGLSDSEFFVLDTLYERKGHASQQDIVNEWTYSKQTVHSAILSLQKKGYVTMRDDADNRRRKIVSLTKAGMAFAEQSVPLLLEAEACSFGEIPEDTVRVSNEVLRTALMLFREKVADLYEEKNHAN